MIIDKIVNKCKFCVLVQVLILIGTINQYDQLKIRKIFY